MPDVMLITPAYALSATQLADFMPAGATTRWAGILAVLAPRAWQDRRNPGRERTPRAGQEADSPAPQDLSWQLGSCAQTPLPSGNWHPAADRLQELSSAISQATVVWPLRGGHGCLDLLPGLDQAVPTLAQQRPPWLIGYSDITVLHAWWWRQGWPQIYGLMPAVPFGNRALSSLQHILEHRHLDLSAAITALCPGSCRGRVFAGCLRLLAALCGTAWQPQLTGCLLFIEDIDEQPYAIDRCLQQCWLAGMLEGIVGLVAGRFPHQPPADHATRPGLADILRHWGQRLDIPTAMGLPFGHAPDPWSIPQGWTGELSIDEAGASLVLLPSVADVTTSG